ncbi:GGDEF domain-containing protein [Actinoplanes sp. Pm04-4]|uniref:GGDEF domain-containing protein n=1 Tax=Paractinoplanes pyxinae TaxID=2997416 RepID=A0ABT4B596_9ACTN|nr:GGDEF domain-containing protein [Actinoplanes pyxinae]MCY1141222.1 GGDEF domain-containing protein [Actinoplanes pyxinae]
MRKLVLIVGAGLLLQLLLPHLPERPGLVLACVPIAAAGLYSAVGFRRQARAATGRIRGATMLGGVAGGLLGLAYALYAAEALGLPVGVAPDLFGVCAAVATVPAILLAAPPFPDRLALGTYLIDVTTVAGAIFASAWHFVLSPAAAHLPAGGQTSFVLTMLPEIVAATLALMLMSRTSGPHSLHLLAAGMALFAVASVGSVWTHAENLPWYSGGLGAAYLVGGLTVAVSSRNVIAPADPTGWRAFTSFWSTLSYLPTVLTLGCVALEYRVNGTPSAVLVWVVLGSSALALVRQFLNLLIVRRLRAELDHRAFHDPLTGLPNRAAFQRDATAALARGDAAVLLLDLDGFKQVNDTQGHAAGDAVLVSVAAGLGELLRTGAIAARLGGDEFAVLLPATDPETAAGTATRILGSGIRGTIGVSHAAEPGRALDEMLHEADVALYEAKAAGKGVVRVYGQGLPWGGGSSSVRPAAGSHKTNVLPLPGVE